MAARLGPLDRDTSPRLGAALDDGMDPRPWGVVLDLYDVSGVTATGLATLGVRDGDDPAAPGREPLRHTTFLRPRGTTP